MNETVQLRVTLPNALQGYLQTKADTFGLTMSAYVKNLIINDVKDSEYPTFEASLWTENAYRNAKSERNKAVIVEDVQTFLDSL